MSQHDYVLANASGASFRADANSALAAIVSNNSGAAEPATMFAGMWWYDTTAALLKRRNAANTAWITIGPIDAAVITATETVTGGGEIATAAEMTAGTADDKLVSPLKLEGRLATLLAGFKNRIINSTGFVNQRADAAALADDTYGHDRWYRLAQSNPIAVSTLTDVENGTPRMMRLTQSNAAAQRMGYAQIVEGKHCKDLRGKTVTFRFNRVRLSASDNVRFAVLEWTGGEDTVTSDVVNDWTSGTYTAGNFFLAANLTVSGVVQQALTANTLTDGSAITVTLGSAFNNLIVFAWTEATVAQNVTFDLAKAKLAEEAAASAYDPVAFDLDVYMCRRRMRKTFPLATQPQQALGINTGEFQWFMDAANTGSCGRYWDFADSMASAPTITLYNPVAANAQIRNFTDTADFTGSGAANVNETGAMLYGTANAGNSAADLIAVHAVAIAEL